MTADIIVIWAGILGLAYLAGAGLYFEKTGGSSRRASPSDGFGRHVRPLPVRIRRSR
ncbi:hypothetical protein RFN28_23885 [Mesorhizobium sp. VK24D]|uniref:Uncharacterized protein n=1 Tax=Mesorhizobium album TaxID=3072314 RepID=A0ABU4Y6D0_9HYPH|nr:hypothetical protein [Mesorhizobium sp. VK24D]MDX8481479.1 hypothetical protein [Mesorhizobium sp. VK24D]